MFYSSNRHRSYLAEVANKSLYSHIFAARPKAQIIYSLIFCAILITQIAQAQYLTQSITGSRIQCINNLAERHACDNIDLLARVSIPVLSAPFSNAVVNDIWGWTDPLTKREYALVGTTVSVVFVDVTDPVNPIHVGTLPGQVSFANLWRDMKVYKDHMYVVVDGRGHNGMQVFDLQMLRTYQETPITFSVVAHYNEITTAHNIAINEQTGFAYLTGYELFHSGEKTIKDNCEGKGLHIVDIRDPVRPSYAGCFADKTTGIWRNGYTHDVQCVVYQGPDVKYRGREICIGSNENYISIADVTDKGNIVKVAKAQYPKVAYAHQGWLTTDQAYFLMNDEGDERGEENTRTIIWDLHELEDPVYHSSFYFPTKTPDHNLYVYGNHMFAANYTSGLRVVDVLDINNPREVAFFDTHWKNDDVTYSGAWSSYRFPGSGTTVVSSNPDGLLVLDPLNVIVTKTQNSSIIPAGFSLSPAYPNPFNPATATTLELPEPVHVRVEALDMLGRTVSLIHEGVLPAGEHMLTFDAGQLAGGSYYIRAKTDHYTVGTWAVLVK